MKKFKIKEQEIFANSLHDALEIYKHKAKDEVYYEDIDSSSEAKKYAKKFGLEVEGRRAPWGGYEFAFEGSPQDLKKLVQELKKIGIEPTWSSVGDSKVNDRDYTDEMAITELEGAIIAIKNENYKKAMEMVRNVFTSLKFQVETSRHLR